MDSLKFNKLIKLKFINKLISTWELHKMNKKLFTRTRHTITTFSKKNLQYSTQKEL